MTNPRYLNDLSGPPSFSVFGFNLDLARWLEPNLIFEQTHGMANGSIATNNAAAKI
jgi:hypothetical protein